ncbi:helix-turn-helix domain-containing protein [Streptomyces cucumeris]|uniref:helix-turn-helix domain-containing protein n=1 Tax=Streptomyces cucumeris TaxID=2962890 RepID=UPI003D727F39
MDEARSSGVSAGQTRDERIHQVKADVAKRLRYVRQHHPEGPFSLAALSKRAEVAKRTLAQAESEEGGNLTIETLVKVAHSLGISRDGYFLDEQVFNEVNSDLAVVAELRRQRVDAVALRTPSATDLPSGSRKELADLLTGILASAAKVREALEDGPHTTDPDKAADKNGS